MLAAKSSTADDDVAAVAEVAAVAHMEKLLPGPLEEDMIAEGEDNTSVGFAATVKMAHTFCFHVQARQQRRGSWIEEFGRSEDMELETYVEWPP